MATPPTQITPEQGTKRLQALRDHRGLSGNDLRNFRQARLLDADLSGLDLSGYDFSGADLSRANLSGARLVKANLSGATLVETDLRGCELLAANLSGANLSEVRADGAGFGSADLTGARCFNARMDGCVFTQATLAGADMRAASLEGARLREADLSGADFSRARMSQADLEKSDIHQTLFVEAVLRQARLRDLTRYGNANWIGADIMDVNFCGASLIRRTINDQNYLHEFRNQSRANAALYWVWWATSDCGRSFLRWGLWTLFLAAVFAGLFETVSIDYGDHPTFMSSLYYSVVTLTTLGYGDVLPASAAAQGLAMLEVTLGYVMLGGLLSIFSNKMARRAD